MTLPMPNDLGPTVPPVVGPHSQAPAGGKWRRPEENGRLTDAVMAYAVEKPGGFTSQEAQEWIRANYPLTKHPFERKTLYACLARLCKNGVLLKLTAKIGGLNTYIQGLQFKSFQEEIQQEAAGKAQKTASSKPHRASARIHKTIKPAQDNGWVNDAILAYARYWRSGFTLNQLTVWIVKYYPAAKLFQGLEKPRLSACVLKLTEKGVLLRLTKEFNGETLYLHRRYKVTDPIKDPTEILLEKIDKAVEEPEPVLPCDHHNYMEPSRFRAANLRNL